MSKTIDYYAYKIWHFAWLFITFIGLGQMTASKESPQSKKKEKKHY